MKRWGLKGESRKAAATGRFHHLLSYPIVPLNKQKNGPAWDRFFFSNEGATSIYSLLSWIIGSSSFVLRSTASTMVRSSTPSAEAATAGMICRPSGKL